MAKKNGKNGHATEETLTKLLDSVNEGRKEALQTNAKTNERIDALSRGMDVRLAAIESRLEEIARNTGRNQRWIESRLQAIESRLGVTPPPFPTE